MRVLFISDLHLNAAEPDNLQAFFGFMQGEARKASHLYILGDLFEYWAGDDDLGDDCNRSVTAALAELAGRGVTIGFLPGNRDFLAGPGFAASAGLTLLPDPHVLSVQGHSLLISHGDLLCTDDIPYQQFRRQVRDPAWRAAFLARPLAERKAIIENLRQRSEQAKQEKDAAIMDVNADAVAALFRQHDYLPLIHGHTHRPARHLHAVDGHTCQRHVLPDWRGQACGLCWDGKHLDTFSPG